MFKLKTTPPPENTSNKVVDRLGQLFWILRLWQVGNLEKIIKFTAFWKFDIYHSIVYKTVGFVVYV